MLRALEHLALGGMWSTAHLGADQFLPGHRAWLAQLPAQALPPDGRQLQSRWGSQSACLELLEVKAHTHSLCSQYPRRRVEVLGRPLCLPSSLLYKEAQKSHTLSLVPCLNPPQLRIFVKTSLKPLPSRPCAFRGWCCQGWVCFPLDPSGVGDGRGQLGTL